MTSISTDSNIINATPEPACYLCGSQGIILHTCLSDHYASAPGKWNLKRCPNVDCGLVWLDPMPAKEDLWKAYRVYYTHPDYVPEDNRKVDWISFLLLKINKPFFKLFEHAAGIRKVEKEWREKADLMFLGEAPPGGRLLDVGCGKGDVLFRFLREGWMVEGLEVDTDAAAYARMNRGLNVHQGELESQRFSDNLFDAITMNHVIEHVHDPVALIRECLRILKPGGRLVLATPNIRCFGHKKFGRNWSHLQSPSHLHLFTKKSLKECAARAGFQSINSFCAPGYAEGGAIRVSIEREEDASGKKRWAFSRWLEESCLKVLAYYLFFIKKDDEAGEEIFLIAIKNKSAF
jgi:2-polyprenyl-3-methyl-5-hydroxy-6-metoxy-1,4-benzoquinol methylase